MIIVRRHHGQATLSIYVQLPYPSTDPARLVPDPHGEVWLPPYFETTRPLLARVLLVYLGVILYYAYYELVLWYEQILLEYFSIISSTYILTN